jgi:beta-glucanase (GH16 family)
MVQFNFWTDDDDYSRSHETLVFLGFDASESFNKYSIYWGEDKIEWYINDELMLKVKNSIYAPTPTIESSELRVMANLWAVNPDLSNWAGEFDINKKKKRVARYKNFKFTPLESCG